MSKLLLLYPKDKTDFDFYLLTWSIYSMKAVAGKGNRELVVRQCCDNLAVCFKNELNFMN